MDLSLHHWHNSAVPLMQRETLFGDRVVHCFVERPASVFALWQNAVVKAPQREAIAHAGQRWTYSEADRQVRVIAGGLRRRGIQRGDRVALLLGNGPAFTFTLFAVQLLGAIAVPLSTREQSPGIAYMLNQCEAKGIVFDAELASRVPPLQQAPGLALRIANGALPGTESIAELIAHGSDTAAVAAVDPEETAVILYTSGTTGSPKGAMLTHVNIAHSVMHFELAMQLRGEDRAALVVPATHVTGLIALVFAMVHVAGTCVIAPPFKAAEFPAFMEREAITYTLMVPAMYSLLLLVPGLGQADLSRWRLGGYGGAPMSDRTIEELRQRLPRLALVNAYGATETTSPTTVSPVASDVLHADSVGVALPCADVRVVDDTGKDVAPGETGELWIGGPMVVAGYWNNPEATASAFTDGYWHSGDIGRLDADGYVYIEDRKKDMLSRGGFKIYSAEVENCLMAYPGILEAAVVGKPCPVLGERVHAFVHAPGLSDLDESLRRHCARALSDYKVPESFTWSAEPLPRNANGKLMKRLLRERLLV